jgi:hypothetical protein
MPDMRQSKLLIEGPLEKMSRDLMTLDRNQYILNGQRTLRPHLHVMSISDNAVHRQCGQEEESSYHILCQCPAVAGSRMEIFGSEWAESIYSSRASNRKVLAPSKKTRLLKAPSEDKGI